jgi:hypothetical protein
MIVYLSSLCGPPVSIRQTGATFERHLTDVSYSFGPVSGVAGDGGAAHRAPLLRPVQLVQLNIDLYANLQAAKSASLQESSAPCPVLVKATYAVTSVFWRFRAHRRSFGLLFDSPSTRHRPIDVGG